MNPTIYTYPESSKYAGIRRYNGEKLPKSPVEKSPHREGYWLIRRGFAGWNSPANRALGFATKGIALATIRLYQSE